MSIQKHREADKFRYYAPNPQSQSNPVLELDEFYSKDEKVPKIDLEAFAKDHNKEKEGIKFEQDMAQLTKELEILDEGKYCHHPSSLLQELPLLWSPAFLQIGRVTTYEQHSRSP